MLHQKIKWKTLERISIFEIREHLIEDATMKKVEVTNGWT